MIDFIGDIHGHADKLEALLLKMDYVNKNGSFTHPERTALFVGDYIDRGPQIRQTLEIVRNMVKNDQAIALMGNHEYNALCFHYKDREGGHLRKHLIKNIIQHYQTLEQFQNIQAAYEENVEWFKTLPLFYETDTFRAVHACWHYPSISYLHQSLNNNRLTDDLIRQSVIKGTPLYNAVDTTLKGIETKMPVGQTFTDKDGTTRTKIRIKWWEDPINISYRNISIVPLENLPETKFDVSLLKDSEFYREDEKPVFFGHYWLEGHPILYRDNICCLDYSVAKKGHLVAYRFNGEQKLDNKNLVKV